MHIKNQEELKREIAHIFDSGANELRIFEMIERFVEKRFTEKSRMNFNVCSTCGACDGRAGMLFGTKGSDIHDCENCNDTKKTGNIVIHSYLNRTEEELNRTFAIVNKIIDKS